MNPKLINAIVVQSESGLYNWDELRAMKAGIEGDDWFLTLKIPLQRVRYWIADHTFKETQREYN